MFGKILARIVWQRVRACLAALAVRFLPARAPVAKPQAWLKRAVPPLKEGALIDPAALAQRQVQMVLGYAFLLEGDEPADVMAFWDVLYRRAARLGHVLAPAQWPRAVKILLCVVKLSAEPSLRLVKKRVCAIARDALRHLALLGYVPAQQALCDLFLLYGVHMSGRDVVLYAPQDPVTRALFYFLSRQWEQYEALDFDQSLLLLAYRGLSEPQRSRLSRVAKTEGRIEWVSLIVGARREQFNLLPLSDAQWDTVIKTLVAKQQWERMWKLAQSAPVGRCAQLLQHLKAQRWLPPEAAEQLVFQQLLRLSVALRPEEIPLETMFLWKEFRSKDCLCCLAFNPTGPWLVGGSRDREGLQVWNLETEETHVQLAQVFESKPTRMALSADGCWAAVARERGVVELYSLPEIHGRHITFLQQPWIWALQFSPDNRWLAIGSTQVNFKSLVDEDAAVLNLRGHYQYLKDFVFSADGRIVVSCGEARPTPPRNALLVWQLPEGVLLRTLKSTQESELITACALTADGRWLAVGGNSGDARLVDLAANSDPVSLEGQCSAPIVCLAFSPGGEILAAGRADGTLQLWHLADGARLQTLSAHRKSVLHLAFSPDGRFLVSNAADHAVYVWRLPEGVKGHTFTLSSQQVSCLLITEDSRFLVTARNDKVIQVWDLQSIWMSCQPLLHMTAPDLAWTEMTLRKAPLDFPARRWLQFLRALLHRQRCYDVEVEFMPEGFAGGDYDIELADVDDL